ncbi:hypothetical protein HJC23_001564 [Cyclotella cryptica]|uniref:RING-type domain-containing protein n=1 Tax=Cyclotella cryptica TaxID=29204 RepID=A0ABD3PXI2_9STRA
MATFTDTSTDCAICFEPLSSAATLTLACGHRWHTRCIREQLAHAQPSRSQRLLFAGCRCAKCNAYCDHPALENLTRRTDGLRAKVDEWIARQLAIDAPEEWRRANSAEEKRMLVEEGRRSYAFYLCGACEEPYFGGTVECADQEEGERVRPEDRLCSVCSNKSQTVCDKSLEHRAFHVWKCRYCCNPSNFLCYGNVHFCNACHERNSERNRSRRRGETVSSLDAIPCTGESCLYPKLDGFDAHNNGESLDCEQVYYCACCLTDTTRNASLEESPGSRNLIVNPSGEQGTRGWTLNPGHCRWKVESMEVPIDSNTRTNFVSSYSWCIMYQTVPVHRFVRTPSQVRIEASAKFMGRTDCPSVFRMEVIATDAGRRILRRIQTDTLNSPVDFWEKACLILEPVEGLHQVTLSVSGKDSRFWRGDYGSKVCHCSIRVLGTEEELEGVLIQG